MKYAKPLQLFEQLMQTKFSERGRLLCFEVRYKYVGFAFSEPDCMFVHAEEPLYQKHANNICINSIAKRIQTLKSYYNIVGIVVGKTYMGDYEDKQANAIIDRLRKMTEATGCFEGVSYTYWDKSCASKYTRFVKTNRLDWILKYLTMPSPYSKLEEIFDERYAAAILQGYLEYSRLANDAWKEIDEEISE